jgi:serine/threonine protein kinase
VRSEVWALGVILYECLTGRHPFGGSGTGMVELSRAVSAGRPPRPSSLAKDPGSRKGPADWKDLDALCSKAMRKELGVRDRYLTVEALRSDLERYLNGQTLEARSPSWGYRISKWAERQRAGIALFVGGMILTSIASTVIQRSPTGGSPADAARQQALSALEQGKQALANKGPYPESYFERSIVLFKESGMSDSADCGDAHLELGLIQLDQKHLADAERETKTAVAIFDKLTQPDKERTEGARKQLAKITSEFAPGATP